jgi:hypothetical protein
MRDHPSFNLKREDRPPTPSSAAGLMISGIAELQTHDLSDSLWYFDGSNVRVWIDIQEVLATASSETGREVPTAVKIPVDFYPLSTLLNKGTLFGVETDLVQRRDINFALFRFATRVSPAVKWPRLRGNSTCTLVLTLAGPDAFIHPTFAASPSCAVRFPCSPASVPLLRPPGLLSPRLGDLAARCTR